MRVTRRDRQTDQETNSGTNQEILASPSLPRKELLELQSNWLAPARSRLLRRSAIARKKRILDLGAGFGHVSSELARRSSGFVTALDINHSSLCEIERHSPVHPVNGDAHQLPYRHASFDLVFCQCALMWINPLEFVLREIVRVLEHDGVLIVIEPDYGAMIEFPPEISSREIWLAALVRAGADPLVGRKLPGLLESVGFLLNINLLEQLHQPSSQRFQFVEELSLTSAEQLRLEKIHTLADSAEDAGWRQISHLPFFLITAVKSPNHYSNK